MNLIVNDASALIDMFKAGLLESYSQLNYKLFLPDVVEDELQSLEGVNLRKLGFEVIELDPKGVGEVKRLRDSHQQLSVADTFSLVVAERFPSSILLTGDAGLRQVALARGVRVHGVLWLLDQLYEANLLNADSIVVALRFFEGDRTVRLPRKVLTEYRIRYEGYG